MQVRRFLCTNTGCDRRTFIDQIDGLTKPTHGQLRCYAKSSRKVRSRRNLRRHRSQYRSRSRHHPVGEGHRRPRTRRHRRPSYVREHSEVHQDDRVGASMRGGEPPSYSRSPPVSHIRPSLGATALLRLGHEPAPVGLPVPSPVPHAVMILRTCTATSEPGASKLETSFGDSISKIPSFQTLTLAHCVEHPRWIRLLVE